MNSGSTKTLFITVQYLKDNTIINDNVDGSLLQPIIKTTHDKYLHPLIGSPLYYALQDKVINNTLTGNYKVLMDDYIIPVLLHYSTYEAVPYFAFKFRNKGVSKQNSDYSEPADLTELSYVRDNIRDTAQFYGERLVDYLCSNSSLFSEYGSIGDGDIAPSSGDYFGGIHIPNRNRNGAGTFGYGLSSGQSIE